MQKTLIDIAKYILVLTLVCAPAESIHAQSASSTTPKLVTETVTFKASSASTGAQQGAEVPDLYVNIGDTVSMLIRSYAPASTPIELYVLIFDTDGLPIKKVTVGTVKNPQTGVYKKYRITINQELLDTIVRDNTDFMRIGYCIGGCVKPQAHKLLKGKIILPQKQPLSSDSLTI